MISPERAARGRRASASDGAAVITNRSTSSSRELAARQRQCRERQAVQGPSGRMSRRFEATPFSRLPSSGAKTESSADLTPERCRSTNVLTRFSSARRPGSALVTQLGARQQPGVRTQVADEVCEHRRVGGQRCLHVGARPGNRRAHCSSPRHRPAVRASRRARVSSIWRRRSSAPESASSRGSRPRRSRSICSAVSLSRRPSSSPSRGRAPGRAPAGTRSLSERARIASASAKCVPARHRIARRSARRDPPRCGLRRARSWPTGNRARSSGFADFTRMRVSIVDRDVGRGRRARQITGVEQGERQGGAGVDAFEVGLQARVDRIRRAQVGERFARAVLALSQARAFGERVGARLLVAWSATRRPAASPRRAGCRACAAPRR